MADGLDPFSEEVRGVLRKADESLSEAVSIFGEDGADTVREKWPNAYRLEGATQQARLVIASADPRLVRKDAADALLSAAQGARVTIREAVDSGAGSLIDAANALLDALAQMEPRLALSGEEARQALERLTKVQSEIEKTKAKGDQLIRDQELRFSEAQAERTSRLEDMFQKTEAELDEGRSAFEKRAEEARKHLDQMKADISKTAASLGGRAVAIDNDKEAREQEKLALQWTIATIALALVAVGISVLVGIEHASQSPESVAGKITIALIFAGIASYGATVARHHRDRAAAARRLAIDLNAFGPFVAELNKEDRDQLRSAMVWRFFSSPSGANQDPDAESAPGPVLSQQINARRKVRKPPEGEE